MSEVTTTPLVSVPDTTKQPIDVVQLAKQISKKKQRVRAHCNPLSDSSYTVPNHPYQFDWYLHYPTILTPKTPDPNEMIPPQKPITFVDIGSGFGGLLLSLSDEFKDQLICGLEIRSSAVEITQGYIDIARATGVVERPDSSLHEWDASNITAVNLNIMKYAPNFFMKGQLTKMFILFADPHFKASKNRCRVINPSFLDTYAYLLAVGGILYTITDVEDLYLWQKKYLDEHPLFERIPDEDLKDKDVCFDLIHTGTHEGVKVTKAGGNKYPACYRRIEYNPTTCPPNKTRISVLE